jgi:hypothetical protein
MLRSPMVFVRRGSTVLVFALAAGACGGLGSDPPQLPPVLKFADGQIQHIIDRGPIKAFYDKWGRLLRIEQDTNADGRPDRIARHDGETWAHRLEIDVDFDGTTDRWEDYTEGGKLTRFAVALQHDGHPQMWTVVGDDGAATRYEYDRDGDAKIERAEVVVGGRIGRVELDTNRDGKLDRWQDWEGGRLRQESMDLDGDGRPDRRLAYAADGRITVERLGP